MGILSRLLGISGARTRLGAFKGGVGALAATGSGFLVSAEEDPEIQFIDATSGETQGSFNGHSAAIEILEVASDAGIVASVEKEARTIRVWSLESFSEVASFERPEAITAIALTSGGSLLAVGQEDGAVEILSVPDGSAVHKLKMPSKALGKVIEEPPEKVSYLALAPSGAYLGAAASDVLLFWRLGGRPGPKIHVLPPHRFFDLEFRADSRFLAAACGSLSLTIRIDAEGESSVGMSDVNGAFWVKDTKSGKTNYVSFGGRSLDTVHWTQDGEALIVVTSEPPWKNGLKKRSLVVSLKDVIGAGSQAVAQEAKLGVGAIGAKAAYAVDSSILAVEFNNKLYGWTVPV